MSFKKELRKVFLEQRNNVKEDDINNKSQTIKEKIFELDVYKNSKCVFTYVNIGNEVKTKDIIKQALADGKIVAVPKVQKNLNKMIFVKIDSLEDLRTGTFNVLEPIHSEEILSDEHTVFLVPGAAFDNEGYRIGYGGGYYDRYLCNAKALSKIGLAFDFQVMDKIPKNKFDIAVDLVITN